MGGREPLGWRTRCSLPPKPPILPQRAFSGGWSGAKTLPLSPRQPSPGNTKKRTSSEASQRDTSVSNSKSPPVWRAFAMYGKTGCRKNLSSPLALLPDQRRQEGRPPAFSAPSQAGAQGQGGNYKTPDLTPAGARQTCSCYGKRNRQHLTKTKPHNAPPRTPGDGGHEESDDGPASSHPPE